MPEIPTQTYSAHVERAIGDIDLQTGEFPMVLATQGESADGHILNIRGADLPDSIPLQIQHSDSPLQTIGTIRQLRVGSKSGLPVLRAVGRIELEGEGTPAEIRRDIALMISRGHLQAVSVRADGIKVRRRDELPSSHPAAVAASEPNLRKRFGLLFERFQPLEGSIVALGADRRAVVGRSLETEGEVAEFWQSVAEEYDAPDADVDLSSFQDESQEPEAPELDVSEITDLRSLEGFLRDAGASRSEAKRIISLCKSEGASTEDGAQTEEVTERNTPEPRDAEPDSATLEDFARDARTVIGSEFQDLRNEIIRECAGILSDALGRVNHHESRR